MNGVIAFWWSAQDDSIPYEAGRAYAQTTRFEYGRVLGWRDYDAMIRVAVGMDDYYSKNGGGSEKYIRNLAKEHDLVVYETIDDIRDEILRLA